MGKCENIHEHQWVRKAGLLRDDNEEDGATADEDIRRPYESDTDEEEEECVGFESDDKADRVADKAILSLFISDTEEEEFSGFSTQEGDDATEIYG